MAHQSQTGEPTTFALPKTGIVRLPVVLANVPVSKGTWYNGIKAGKYPKPIKLSERCVGWKAEEIHEVIDNMERVL